jgi:hypothetical protein
MTIWKCSRDTWSHIPCTVCHISSLIELSVKYSKDSTKALCLLKMGNKVVEVGWVHSKVEDEEGTTVGSKLGTTTSRITLLYKSWDDLSNLTSNATSQLWWTCESEWKIIRSEPKTEVIYKTKLEKIVVQQKSQYLHKIWGI